MLAFEYCAELFQKINKDIPVAVFARGIAGTYQHNFSAVQYFIPGILILNKAVLEKFKILLLQLFPAQLTHLVVKLLLLGRGENRIAAVK
jgi:hypothetical protein